MIKKTLELLIMLTLSISLTACSSQSGKVEFAPRSDIKAKLTNYKITVEFTGADGTKTEMTEMRCDEGYLWAIGDSIQYVEYGTGKQYQLYCENKSGMIMNLDNENEYKDFGTVVSAYLFFFDTYRNFDVKKSGNEKIAERNTTSYTFQYDGNENKFWIDNEYGVTMKYSAKVSGQSVLMEIRDFQAGGITLADMINLSDYEIVEINV